MVFDHIIIIAVSWHADAFCDAAKMALKQR
jgi:hypothetical protein